MASQPLLDAIARAERAIERIERAAARIERSRGRDERLRSTVRDVVAELDSIIGAGRG
jgi:hypothetical protein